MGGYLVSIFVINSFFILVDSEQHLQKTLPFYKTQHISQYKIRHQETGENSNRNK